MTCIFFSRKNKESEGDVCEQNGQEKEMLWTSDKCVPTSLWRQAQLFHRSFRRVRRYPRALLGGETALMLIRSLNL